MTVRPLTDLGIAVPLGNPKFGFKPRESVAVQASAGIMVRGFIADGALDLRLGVGVTNAVGSDGTTGTIGLAWTAQVSAFGVLGLGILGITNPQNERTGVGAVFALDLVGIRDVIGDAQTQ